jgi:hypothetical protein
MRTVTPAERWKDYVAMLTPAAGARAAEELPAYPNAEEFRVTPNNFLNQPDEIEFYTSDQLVDVGEFYNVVLARMGWEIGETWSAYDSIGQSFVWPDNPDSLYKLIVRILIMDGCPRDRNSNVTDATNMVEKRCVQISLIRQPFASRVPLYPGAQSTKIREEDVNIRPPFLRRTTQYIANASLKEVESFYSTIMASNGWVRAADIEMMGTRLVSIHEGIEFVDPTTPDIDTNQPHVIISARAEDKGQTEVTIIAEGPELKTSSP